MTASSAKQSGFVTSQLLSAELTELPGPISEYQAPNSTTNYLETKAGTDIKRYFSELAS